MGNKGKENLGKTARHPILAYMWGGGGNEGRYRKKFGRPDTVSESNTSTHAEIQGERRKDNGRESKHPDQRHTCGETTGHKGGQGLVKRNVPSNTNIPLWKPWKTIGDKTSSRPTQHPTQACVGGDTWRQEQTRLPEGGRRTHHPTKGNKKG